MSKAESGADMNEDGSGKSSPRSSAANWIADFLKPINVIFLLIAVISVCLSVIFYWSSQRNAQISYYSNTIQVVDQKEPGPFSVLDSMGRSVKENIYATNVTVWNSGNLPLEPDKVRRPLQISLTGGDETHLLDAKIPYTTSGNVSDFKLTVIYSNTGGRDIKINENGVAEIAWKYFDPGEGFRLKLIYASKEQQSVTIEGVIFGVNSFVDITPPPKGKVSLKAPGFPQMVASGSFLILGSLLQIASILARKEQRDGTTQSRAKRQIMRYAGYAGSLFTALGIFLVIWAVFDIWRPPNPPF